MSNSGKTNLQTVDDDAAWECFKSQPAGTPVVVDLSDEKLKELRNKTQSGIHTVHDGKTVQGTTTSSPISVMVRFHYPPDAPKTLSTRYEIIISSLEMARDLNLRFTSVQPRASSDNFNNWSW